MIRLTALLLVVFLIGTSVYSQSLESFQYLGDPFSGYGYLGVSYSHSRTKNEDVPRPDMHNLSGNFFELNYKHQNLNKGTWQYDLRGKMYTDVIKQLIDIIGDRESAYTQLENTGLTTGPLGWHTFAYNAAGSNRVLISPGIHLNDYFFFVNARDAKDVDKERPELTTKEPQGYYFGAGPSFLLSVVPSKYLMINIKSQYSLTYWRPVSVSDAVKDDAYPKPHFFGFTTEFLTPWGIYFEIDHNRLINRGDLPNAAMRTDFNIGFKFVKDQ